MRKWHRWLAVFFGVFLLWIAVTGVASQIAPLMVGAAGPHQQNQSLGQGSNAPATPSFVCPPDYVCRPKPKADDPRALIGWLHHLHSGESFGPLGVVISTLSGLAMMFFSISGLWLYIQMWRNRRVRNLSPRWFW